MSTNFLDNPRICEKLIKSNDPMKLSAIKGIKKKLESKHALWSNWQSNINPRVDKVNFKCLKRVCVYENSFDITHNP